MNNQKLVFWFAVLAVIFAGAAIFLVGIQTGFLGISGTLQQSIEDLKERVGQIEKNVSYFFDIALPVPAVTTSSGIVFEFSNGTTVYVAGDTGTDINFEMIREFYAPEVFAVPVGGGFTVDGRGAAYLTSKIQPEVVLPYHYGSGVPLFPADPSDFLRELNKVKSQGKTNAEVIVMKPGNEFFVKGIKVVWLGHAGLLFEGPKGSRIMIDPEWNFLNSTRYPIEYKDPAGKGGVDFIAITHGHPDHFDVGAIKVLLQGSENHKPVLFGVFELLAAGAKYLPADFGNRFVQVSLGAPWNKQSIEARLGQHVTLQDDVTATLVWASHGPGFFLPVEQPVK